MLDDDVTAKKGMYPYVLDGKESHLNVRGFSDAMKREAYERHEGGKTNAGNCQMLCSDCNRKKSGK